MERIVLAYAGGAEAAAAIAWLKAQQAAEVVTVTIDVGQGCDLEAARNRALGAGAARAHVLDLREVFVRDFILPAFKGDALGVPSGGADGHARTVGAAAATAAALVRPLIGRALVEVAAIERAASVAHGCTEADRGAVEAAVRALNPALDILAPACDPDAHLRFYPTEHAVEGTADAATLWGRAGAGSSFTLTKAAADCPDEAAVVEIGFERGTPVAINGVGMPVLELVSSLNTIAGAHGVGRGLLAAEAPAALVLHAAHAALQTLVSSDELAGFARSASRQYAALIEQGRWYTPFREALDAFVDRVQMQVSGVVRLRLFKGDLRIVALTSPHAAGTRDVETPIAAAIGAPQGAGAGAEAGR